MLTADMVQLTIPLGLVRRFVTRQNPCLGQMAVSVGAMLGTLGAGACGEPTAVNPGELRVETVPRKCE